MRDAQRCNQLLCDGRRLPAMPTPMHTNGDAGIFKHVRFPTISMANKGS
jgi:hypothetical protein